MVEETERKRERERDRERGREGEREGELDRQTEMEKYIIQSVSKLLIQGDLAF